MLAPLARQGGLTDAATAGPAGAASGVAAKGGIVPVWEIDAPSPARDSGDDGVPQWAALAVQNSADAEIDSLTPVRDPAGSPPPPRDAAGNRKKVRLAVALASSVLLALTAVAVANAVSRDDTDPPLATGTVTPTRRGGVPVVIGPSLSPTVLPTTSGGVIVLPNGSPDGVASPPPEQSPSPGAPTPSPSPSPVDDPPPPSAHLTAFGLSRGTENDWTGNITLTAPAPAGGFTVTISYNFQDGSQGVSTPTTVVVPAGETSVDFQIQADIVTDPEATSSATASSPGDQPITVPFD
jgi:hypothetical protein